MFTIEQIETAHSKVKSGADFPKYIQEIKGLGVIVFETYVSDSHTIYYGKDNFETRSKPKNENLTIAGESKKVLFIHFLKIHQQGETDYLSFCKHCAETGIEKWVVNLNSMSYIYYNSAGSEILIEKIPG